MQKRADIIFEHNQFFVSGDLDFSNVMLVYKKFLSQIKKETLLHFDFSKVTSSNSAGLALIIEWVKFASQHHQSIQLKNLPQQLLSIAKAAGLEEILVNSN